MKDKFKFSVLILVYIKENPNFFKEALESIYDIQTLKPNEIVLVEDGKLTDELYKVIDNFKKKAGDILKIIKLQKNMGHGIARRVGIKNCSYNLIALMDSDDISYKDRFKLQINCFKNNPEVSVVGSNLYEFIDTADNIISIREVFQEDEDIKKDMKKRCPINQPTVMLKKDDINMVGGYIDFYCEEDYYLWIRLAISGYKFKNISESLVYFRTSSNMYKRRSGVEYFLSEAKIQIYMRKNKIISLGRMVWNIMIRFSVQVLFPNGLRAFIFKKFARKTRKEGYSL